MCKFYTESVILHIVCYLRCFVASKYLSRIYALLSVKIPGLKMCECKKMTNMRYGDCKSLTFYIFALPAFLEYSMWWIFKAFCICHCISLWVCLCHCHRWRCIVSFYPLLWVSTYSFTFNSLCTQLWRAQVTNIV